MIPEKDKYIDKLRQYNDNTLEILWGLIKDGNKRRDIKYVMVERGLM